jgi:hypothetical protein
MNWYRAGLPSMALNGRLTSATSKRTLSVRKFSAVSNVTGREMQPRGVTGRELPHRYLQLLESRKADEIEGRTPIN